jgi:histidyl-tRNA synthetase
MTRFANPRGTQDILPDDWVYWDFVLGHAFEVARLFGYRRIETPVFGETTIFARTSGQGTDIVDKEMYVFEDREGNSLSLRPEGTAPVVRAYLEHGMSRLPQPVKLFYVERMYRYDRPQRGRYREHRQFGCEAIGLEDAYIDVEMIALLDMFYRRIGLDELSLHINSIGDYRCRPAYLSQLAAYLREHLDELSAQDRERVERNPLRVLDSKDPESQGTISGAPHMLDYLCGECKSHWERLRHGLAVLGIEADVNFRLVRGLDYYTRTVFEFLPPVAGAQSVVGGGGRYDALSEAMGGPHIPGIGFGTGIERLVLNVREKGIAPEIQPGPTVYVAHIGSDAGDEALRTAARLRHAGISADMAFGGRSLKTQLKHSNANGARVTVIIGEDEVARDAATLRSMDSGEQQSIASRGVVEAVEKLARDSRVSNSSGTDGSGDKPAPVN